MWSLLAFLVALVFILYGSSRYYVAKKRGSKYGKFTPKKKR
jgi:hypothetical protein